MIGIVFLANNLLFKSVIYTLKPIRAVRRLFFYQTGLFIQKLGLAEEVIAIFFFSGGKGLNSLDGC